MFRYFAISWGADDPTQASVAQHIRHRLKATSTGWQRAFACNGMRVYCADATNRHTARPLAYSAGVVLGVVFPRVDPQNDPVAPVTTFSAEASKRIVASQARALVADYWGSYVAFVRDHLGGQLWVLKDPTGLLPCLRVEHRGVQCFFSFPRDYLALGLTRFHIDWSCIAESVAAANLAGEGQPLKELDELTRGECWSLDTRSSRVTGRQLYWDPAALTHRSRWIDDPQRASTLLNQTVRHCVRSWANLHDHLIHRLSGGLDSSIVLGVLTRPAPGHPAITCVTYHGDDASGDERRWASIAADAGARPLHAHRLEMRRARLDGMVDAQPMAAPTWLLSHYLRSGFERSIARDHSATAILSGEGGDSIFGSLSITAAMDEHLQRWGLRRGAFKLAGQIAAYRDNSALRVLWGAMRRQLFGTRFHERAREYDQFGTLLSPALQELLRKKRRQAHPFLHNVRGTPWGLIHRLGSLMVPPEFYDAYLEPEDFHTDWLHPLFAQPIVELCMTITLKTHFLNGRDRGLARTSFRTEVPEPILKRQWKGRGSTSSAEIVYYNLPFIRSLLLDGALVRERLVDRPKLERVLTDAPSNSPANTAPVIFYMHMELWLRQWQDTDQWIESTPRTAAVV